MFIPLVHNAPGSYTLKCVVCGKLLDTVDAHYILWAMANEQHAYCMNHEPGQEDCSGEMANVVPQALLMDEAKYTLEIDGRDIPVSWIKATQSLETECQFWQEHALKGQGANTDV